MMTIASKDAFSLMQYQSEEDPKGPIEWIWNSRDGVTPFMVGPIERSQDEPGTMMKHINWQDDILALQYVPNIGQRVFVDLTEAAARKYLSERIDRQWHPKDSDFKMSSQWETKAEAFEDLLPDMMEEVNRHGPDIVTVDLEMQRKFVEEREERRQQVVGKSSGGIIMPRGHIDGRFT